MTVACATGSSGSLCHSRTSIIANRQARFRDDPRPPSAAQEHDIEIAGDRHSLRSNVGQHHRVGGHVRQRHLCRSGHEITGPQTFSARIEVHAGQTGGNV
ncbi:hypothetical protein NMD1_03139 [Novosphingobium sp. MD-1]|nr:hypothetical protein NMD1_03139 [Novosphingobium sp. MD-1]